MKIRLIENFIKKEALRTADRAQADGKTEKAKEQRIKTLAPQSIETEVVESHDENSAHHKRIPNPGRFELVINKGR